MAGIKIQCKKYIEHIKWHGNGKLDTHFYHDGKKFYKKFIQMYVDGKTLEVANYNSHGELEGEYFYSPDNVTILYSKGKIVIRNNNE